MLNYLFAKNYGNILFYRKSFLVFSSIVNKLSLDFEFREEQQIEFVLCTDEGTNVYSG